MSAVGVRAGLVLVSALGRDVGAEASVGDGRYIPVGQRFYNNGYELMQSVQSLVQSRSCIHTHLSFCTLWNSLALFIVVTPENEASGQRTRVIS